MQEQEKQNKELHEVVYSMKEAITQTLAGVQPLVEKNNQLIDENNELRKEVVNLQKKLQEENEYNDKKYNFYIHDLVVLADIQQWLGEYAQPWMEEISESLGKRPPQLRIGETFDELRLKAIWMKDDIRNRLIADGYHEKCIERILRSTDVDRLPYKI